MVSAIEPIAVVMKPAARNGLRMNSSERTPTSPATTKAASNDGTTGQPSQTLARKPAKAPMVIFEARAKLVKRRTAKIAVRPIAGTARMVPDIKPLRISCATCIYQAAEHRARVRLQPPWLNDLEETQLPVDHLHVAETAALNVTDIGEVARSGGTLVVDLLALSQELQTLDRAIDLLSRALTDFAHVVLERAAGCLLRLRQRQDHQARPIGGLC